MANAANILNMFRQRKLDVYSAKPLARSIQMRGYSFGALGLKQFEDAEFCRPRLNIFEQRLIDGFKAYGLLTKEYQLAYYMWVSFADQQGWAPWAFGARIELPALSGYIFDCKTAPEHRNKGLYTAALKYARWLCQEAGCKKVLIDVEPHNEPAVRAIRNAGFSRAATTEIRRYGPLIQTSANSRSSFGWRRAEYAF